MFNIILILPLHPLSMLEEKKMKSKILDGEKGKLMLEINKTFKGDSRFRLD
jgi:hypothetical protein